MATLARSPWGASLIHSAFLFFFPLLFRVVFPPDLSQNQWLLSSPPLCLNLSPDACLAAEHREEALICTGCCIKGQPLGSLGGVWRGMKSSVLLKQSRKSLEVTVVAGETYPKQGFIGLSLSSHSSHIECLRDNSLHRWQSDGNY